ncbi:MAG TPA: hypothetical protein VKH15_04210 [Candidatus Acidoferrum sp.]|nr:hypothetical protein [Candidatus Acidoferrum sp.]
MPYEFQEWEEELQPQAASARMGGPPRKSIGMGVLDPPVPPKRPPGPLAASPSSFLMRILAGLILACIGLFLLYLLFAR